MSAIGRFLKMFSSQWISPEEIRAEAWALGGRHMGEVLQGARTELRDPGLTARRTVLLKAVIRSYA